MTFLNGDDFESSSGDWNRERTGANTSSNFAYGSTITDTVGIISYYYNDALVYTSLTDMAFGLYPYITYYDNAGDITINSDYIASKRIDFTINDYGSSYNNSGLGLNDNTNQDGWQGLNASFSFDEGKYWVYETLPTPERKTDKIDFTPANGDVWSLRWGTPSTGNGTRLPPPPITVRF